MALPKSIKIRELGPREGFQTLPQVIPTDKKLELIDLLGQTGVSEIELTSFVRPDRVPQMADAEQVVQGFKQYPGVKYTALYLNEQGYLRAQNSKRLENDGWIYLAASATFLKSNNNTTIDAVIDGIPNWLKLFKEHGNTRIAVMISTAFGCNYEGKIDQQTVVKILDRAVAKIKAGGAKIAEISLADTMGHATPEATKRLVETCQEKFAPSIVSLHLHDTRGSGLANVYAGLEVGVELFDCSIGGMGGCPFAKGAAGNICTEDVVYMCEEMGVRTGVKLDVAIAAAKLATQIIGAPLPGKLHKSAF